MHEAEQSRINAELLNHYFQQDLLEREEHNALVQAYHEWDQEEGSMMNVGVGEQEDV
jgi:hypothetical protein